MQAIRNIYTVKNNQVIIDLPESFDYSSVEVIVLPVYSKEIQNKSSNEALPNNKDRLAKLLTLSVWDDDDINRIIESQKLVNKWKIEQF